MILSEQTLSKEYQIPELIDLNSVREAMGIPSNCTPGSSALNICSSGGVNAG